jgi:hypothetical protein
MGLILINLANLNPEFKDYVENSTGLTMTEILAAPLANYNNLQFYIRKKGNSIIQGWACYTDNVAKMVEFKVYLNNVFVTNIQANRSRDDLIDAKGNAPSVGYTYDFENELQLDDLVTILIGDEVVYLGGN